MSSAMIVVTTKPADTAWFAAAHPDAVKRLADWAKAQPGFITSSIQRIAPNTMQNIAIFDTRANLDAFVAALAAHPDNQAREEYKAANGQVSTVTLN